MRKCCHARLGRREEVGPGIFLIRLMFEGLPQDIQPGQFLFLRESGRSTPLLGRPFGVHACGEDWVEVLFDVVGVGTRLLATLPLDSGLDCLLPLGQGWPPYRAGQPLVLVAGGLGLPPLFFLAQQLHAQGLDFSFVYGAQNQARLVLQEELAAICRQLTLCTDDGSAGKAGFVNAHLPSYEAPARFFVCGPTPMMRAVAQQVLAQGHECFVSLEEHMACALGVCMGCTCRVRQADGQMQSLRTCVEGPVINAAGLLWPGEAA